MAIITNKRSSEEIIRDGRKKLEDNVGITAYNSTSSALSLLELSSREISNMWDTMNDLLKRNFITTAYGESLDAIGELLQESRRNSTRAMDLSTSNIKFSLDTTYATNISDLLIRYYNTSELAELNDLGLTNSPTNPTEITFDEGIYVISRDGKISYSTTRPITLSNTQDFDYTPVIANGIGDGWNVGVNVLVKHNLVTIYPILSKIINGIQVTNIYGIGNGGGTESDSNYRFRLANKTVSATKGNNSAIRKAVLSVPGVVDMQIITRSHGNGTLTIFPKTEDPIVSDGILSAVKESVNFDKSIGTIVYVEPPKYLGVSMRINLRFIPGADKDLIFGNARLAIMDYINNLDEGGEIIINEIIQRTMAVDDKIIDMNITGFGYGEYDRISGIITNFTPLRLSNQKAEWDERWFINSSLCNICETQ